MSQSISAFAIQPVNLNTIPRKAEGSKAVLITQRWNDPALAGGLKATFNLLSQYQSGQFTDIQAVWIDNSTNYVPVVFTSVETGHVIRCPALGQGMYPVVSAAAPVFTLELAASFIVPSGTTKLMLFNTPQRFFQNPGTPVFQNVNRSEGQIGVLPTTWLTTATVFGPNQFFCLTGFQLSMSIASGSFGVTFTNTVSLLQNGNIVFEDQFTCTSASAAVIYDKAINFSNRTNPLTATDIWTIAISTPPVGGLLEFVLIYYFDILNLQ